MASINPGIWLSAKGDGQATIPIRGDFVALVNNDTIVTPGWLERLVSLCSESADVDDGD